MAKWGKCDFRQLEQMQKQLEKMEKERTAFCEACAKELAARLLALVIKRTPVGKAPKLAEGQEKTVKVKVRGADGRGAGRRGAGRAVLPCGSFCFALRS